MVYGRLALGIFSLGWSSSGNGRVFCLLVFLAEEALDTCIHVPLFFFLLFSRAKSTSLDSRVAAFGTVPAYLYH